MTLYVYLSFCLSLCLLSVFSFLSEFPCFLVILSFCHFCLFVLFLFVYLSVYLSFFLCFCFFCHFLSIYLYLFLCLSLYMSFFLSICLFIFLSIFVSVLFCQSFHFVIACPRSVCVSGNQNANIQKKNSKFFFSIFEVF